MDFAANLLSVSEPVFDTAIEAIAQPSVAIGTSCPHLFATVAVFRDNPVITNADDFAGKTRSLSWGTSSGRMRSIYVLT